jgi:hypothetical protein
MNKLKKAPARSKLSILHQICNYIPQHLVSKIARTTGAEDKSRTFKPWSHVVRLAYAQLTHSIGLNDLCDSLQLHSGTLAGIRGATHRAAMAFPTPTANDRRRWPSNCFGRC